MSKGCLKNITKIGCSSFPDNISIKKLLPDKYSILRTESKAIDVYESLGHIEPENCIVFSDSTINTSLRKKNNPIIVKLQNWINLICKKVKLSYIRCLALSASTEMEKSDTAVYETVVSSRILVAKLMWPCWGPE